MYGKSEGLAALPPPPPTGVVCCGGGCSGWGSCGPLRCGVSSWIVDPNRKEFCPWLKLEAPRGVCPTRPAWLSVNRLSESHDCCSVEGGCFWNEAREPGCCGLASPPPPPAPGSPASLTAPVSTRLGPERLPPAEVWPTRWNDASSPPPPDVDGSSPPGAGPPPSHAGRAAG